MRSSAHPRDRRSLAAVQTRERSNQPATAMQFGKTVWCSYVLRVASEQHAHAGRHPEAGEINRIEVDEIRTKRTGRPQVSSLELKEPLSIQPQISAAKYVRARRPSLRLEHVAEHRQVEEVDEIAPLEEPVIDGTAAGPHIRHDAPWDPREPAQRLSARPQRNFHAAADVHVSQFGLLRDRQVVIVNEPPVLGWRPRLAEFQAS